MKLNTVYYTTQHNVEVTDDPAATIVGPTKFVVLYELTTEVESEGEGVTIYPKLRVLADFDLNIEDNTIDAIKDWATENKRNFQKYYEL